MSDLVVRSTALIQQFAQSCGIALPDDEFEKPQFVPADFSPGWFPEFSEEFYHRDLTAVARGDIVMATKSTKHFRARRQAGALEETEPLRFGRLIHMLILEPEKLKRLFVLMPDFGDMRSSKNRDLRDAWKAALDPGAVIVTQEDMVKLFCMSRSVLANKLACDLLTGAQFEMTGYYRDPITGLKGRFKPDAWNPNLLALVDLKSTQDASDKEFLWSAWKFRYDIQLAGYGEGILGVHGVRPSSYAIIAVEKLPPWECVVHVASLDFIKRGLRDYRIGLDRIASAVMTNTYTGYGSDACELLLPNKAKYE